MYPVQCFRGGLLFDITFANSRGGLLFEMGFNSRLITLGFFSEFNGIEFPISIRGGGGDSNLG